MEVWAVRIAEEAHDSVGTITETQKEGRVRLYKGRESCTSIIEIDFQIHRSCFLGFDLTRPVNDWTIVSERYNIIYVGRFWSPIIGSITQSQKFRVLWSLSSNYERGHIGLI